MISKMNLSVCLVLFCFTKVVLLQETGSGKDRNLRLCFVDAGGFYKQRHLYCSVLDKEKAGVECVLGTDRLDCLRRINKGTVDFGVFRPQDLVAAQWADIDVLVTNEFRYDKRPFDLNIVAVVNRRILPDHSTSLHAVLKNSTLCHPGETINDFMPLSEKFSGYLASLVLERSCDATLSNTENKLKALADFFGKACMAGPWVPDDIRDAELKRQYPSLCAACARSCTAGDLYWSDSGSLTCLTDGMGDFTWGEAKDIAAYFKIQENETLTDNFAYLCRNGTWRDLTQEPCIWLQRPWNIIVAKRKASAAVSKLIESLTNSSVTEDWQHWPGALVALLQSTYALLEPLHPPQPPMDYLARAKGFKEAHSQAGCDPPRHINFCTTSLLAKNKCDWLSEAGAVYGIAPPLQCVMRNSIQECLKAVQAGESDATAAGSDWLVAGIRDYSLTPILHEVTRIVEKTNTVVAYINSDSQISKMADLRGKRAAFPRYDGAAWHSVKNYIKIQEKISCKEFMNDYFKEICAPGLDGKKCYEEGEAEALKSLVQGKSDVAFVSLMTYKAFKSNNDSSSENVDKIVPLCPEGNQNYCFISWSTFGHIFAANNLATFRKHEIVNVFTKLDQLFGIRPPFNDPMFSMYGSFNHELDVIFHSNTESLVTTAGLKTYGYNKIPYNLELSLLNMTDFTCDFGAKTTPSLIMLLVTLVVFLINS